MLSQPRDTFGPNNTAHATKGGTPIFHHLQDLPKGMAVADAVNQVIERCGKVVSIVPTFCIFRTILQPASFHYQVAKAASEVAPNLVWVDPIAMGILAKLQIADQDGHN